MYLIQWTLTSSYVSYDRAFAACPENYVFDCPRTAEQNRMLYQVIQKDLRVNAPLDPGFTDPLHRLFWINLNSGSSTGSCWVIGAYATCWWLNDVTSSFRTCQVRGKE